VNKEVFFYYNSNVGEIMLYRFGMEIGDTAIVSSMACESINMIVTDIDTIIDMHGIERPRMLMDPWYYWYDEYWIEGIGSSLGLLTAGNFSCIADFNQELLCFSYDEDLAYMNPLYEKCFITEVGIDDKIKEAESIMIIPNPVIGKSTIKLPSGVNIQEMIVLDSYGRTKEILWTTSSYLNKDDYTPGVYFLRIQTEKKVYTSKFIIR